MLIILHRSSIFKCDQCSKTFTYKTTLQRHIQNKHSQNAGKKACHCGKLFRDITDLERHKRIHLQKKQCNKCHKFISQQFHQIHQANCSPPSLFV